METRAGNAFVNLYLDLGHAQDHHGHRNTSRERRRQKRAAERYAAAQSVEEAELDRETDNDSTLRSTENVAKKDHDGGNQRDIIVLYLKEFLKIQKV